MLPSGPINYVDQSVGTQSVKSQIETKASTIKQVHGNNIIETLVEPLKDTSTTSTLRTISLPVKDRLAIVRKVERTHKTKFKEDTEKSRTLGVKSLAKAFVKKVDPLQEQKMREGYESTVYANGTPVKAVDHVSNTEMTDSKFATNKEYSISNRKGSNTLPTPSDVDSFKFDTDPTMNNYYMTRRGLLQRQSQLAARQEYDNQISPLSDGVNPYRTKYT